jgi:flagellar biosynthesis/type III secretory pathway chaperone
MKIITDGKDAVLHQLEDEARQRAKAEGKYLVANDDQSNLVAFIAGHAFVGAGSISLGCRKLEVSNGIVMAVS